ncbi:hypothetical protein PtA15_11A348 [Puccinia triticina]|uniref:Uncharacterized protein n=1 Tax=Puccinia triticina TaxID=208348 RepID=A0ABY7CXM0_9BASI|nr:uncharacterized protein PtA15_11A348 [Puccinia triticina]WAQ89658.1 hypothetical protein PtA15_11A348 [Puccinia triticina]
METRIGWIFWSGVGRPVPILSKHFASRRLYSLLGDTPSHSATFTNSKPATRSSVSSHFSCWSPASAMLESETENNKLFDYIRLTVGHIKDQTPCSTPKTANTKLFDHIWTTPLDEIKEHRRGPFTFTTKVSVDLKPEDKNRHGIWVMNPLPVPVTVRVNVIFNSGPASKTEHIIQPTDTYAPIQRLLCELDKKPIEVEVHYTLPTKVYNTLEEALIKIHKQPELRSDFKRIIDELNRRPPSPPCNK